jgi:hypothetical protein
MPLARRNESITKWLSLKTRYLLLASDDTHHKCFFSGNVAGVHKEGISANVSLALFGQTTSSGNIKLPQKQDKKVSTTASAAALTRSGIMLFSWRRCTTFDEVAPMSSVFTAKIWVIWRKLGLVCVYFCRLFWWFITGHDNKGFSASWFLEQGVYDLRNFLMMWLFCWSLCVVVIENTTTKKSWTFLCSRW